MSFIDSFDVDEEKMAVVDEALRQDPRSHDRRICICGHSMSRHDKITKACKPARFECPCKRVHPVIEVPNTRFFLGRTGGSGERHALTRGIFRAREAMGEDFDTKAKWLVDLKCENPACGKETKLYPVMCDEDGYRLYDRDSFGNCSDRGVTAFLCELCREIYTDSEEANIAKRQAMKDRN